MTEIERVIDLERMYLVRDIVDDYIEKIEVDKNKNLKEIRKNEYTHSYGVSSLAQMLAEKRGLDVELAGVIGLLHDIGRIMYNILDETHGKIGAIEAEKILYETKAFSKNEVEIICTAIKEHSNKTVIGSKYEELIKDADIMERYLWKREYKVKYDEGARIPKIRAEFNLIDA